MESKPTREESERAAALWLLKRADPQWSHADEEQLEHWLAAAPGNRVSFIRLESTWTEADRLKSIAAGFPKGHVPLRGTIEQSPFFTLQLEPAPPPPSGEREGDCRTESAPQSRTKRRFFALAASLVMAVAASALAVYITLGHPAGRTYSTSIGGLSTIPISDGSIVTLNTDSEMEVRFTDRERRIDLKKGEAFFEVAKDPRRPFTVYANDHRVIAVGTQFSVRLKPDAVHVAVTEGKVRLQSASAPLLTRSNLFPSSATLRAPGQGQGATARKAPQGDSDAGTADALLTAGTVADIGDHRIRLAQVPVQDIDRVLSWRTGYIALNDTLLSDAVAEFNRYNIRQLTLEDASLAALRVEGNFRSNNLDGFVRLLEEGFGVKAQQSPDGHIALTRR